MDDGVYQRYVRPGLGHVGSYQISAIPWLSGSITVPGSAGPPLEISFYNVTSFVDVTNLGPQTIRFGFSSTGVQGTNYNSIFSGSSFSADYRVSSIFLISATVSSSVAEIAAGLTGIDAKEINNDTTLNWSGSVGVG